MRIQPQASAALTRLCGLIEPLSVAMLTNLDGEGELVSRPMTPQAMDAQGALWFFTDLRAQKVEQLSVVNLSFTDAGKGIYVSLSGRGEIDTDRGRIEWLSTSFTKPFCPVGPDGSDGPDSQQLALLKFVPASAEYWDAPNSKMVRMFALAAPVVAAKPIGLGEHER